MLQIQLLPTSRMWGAKRAGVDTDQPVFAPLNGLVSWWQIGDYFGFISGSFVGGVTGVDQGPANATLTQSGVVWNTVNDRGDNRGAGEFSPDAFIGRNDINVGAFNPSGSFTVTAWVKLIALTQGLIVSYSIGGTSYWQLGYQSSSQRFFWFILGQTGSGGVLSEAFGAPSTGVWYLLEGYYDARNNTAGLRVMASREDGLFIPTSVAADTGVIPGGRLRAGAILRIGAQAVIPSASALICGVGFWSRLLLNLERGTINRPFDYNWVVFSPAAGASSIVPYAQAGPAPSDLIATGNPRLVSFTDNTDSDYQHEIWRDDGGGWFPLATLNSGVTEYQDDTAITEESVFATEGGDEFETEGSDTTFFSILKPEGQSRYKVRAIGLGNPSDFSNEFDPATSEFLGSQGNEILVTEGNDPLIPE